MRKGKMVAQGAHASLGAVFLIQEDQDLRDKFSGAIHDAANTWLEGAFSKICVSVDSEQQLMEVFGAAQQAKLPVKLITDSGRTEFNGVPTRTCLAIGPAWADEIDKITGELKLL